MNAQVEVCVGELLQNGTIRIYHITIRYQDINKVDSKIFSLSTDFKDLQKNHNKHTAQLNITLSAGFFSLFTNYTTNIKNCEYRANEIKKYVTDIVALSDGEKILTQLGFSKKELRKDYYELSKTLNNDYFKLFYFNKAIKKGNKEILQKFLENKEFEDFVADCMDENTTKLGSQNVDVVQIFIDNPKLFPKLTVVIKLLFFSFVNLFFIEHLY